MQQEELKRMAAPRQITNASTGDAPWAVEWTPVREGSQDHEEIPSKFGNSLVYRDGRREVVQ